MLPLLPANNPPSPYPLEPRLKPTRQPMLWAALSYSAGIISGVYLWRPPSWWLAAAVAFLLASLFLLGALHIQLTGSSYPLDTSLQPFADAQTVEMTAHVTREGRLLKTSSGEFNQTLDVESEEILPAEDGGDPGKPVALHSGVRLGIYSAEPSRPLRYGERLRLPVKLKLPHNFRNPGAFDYQAYLASKRIAARASAKAAIVEL